jgi:hypothetical protein
MGIVIEPVPVAGFAANFSPMPRIAPPPFERLIEGGEFDESPLSVRRLVSRPV